MILVRNSRGSLSFGWHGEWRGWRSRAADPGVELWPVDKIAQARLGNLPLVIRDASRLGSYEEPSFFAKVRSRDVREKMILVPQFSEVVFVWVAWVLEVVGQ